MAEKRRALVGGLAVAAIVSAMWVPIAEAARLHVCPKLGGLQQAVDAAVDGDEVVLEPGVYNGGIVVGNKAITIRSISPDNPAVVADTVIRCNGTSAGPGRGFTFRDGQGADTVLEGLTIQGGYGPQEVFEGDPYSAGGGVYIEGAGPTIRNCVFDGCGAGDWGGGIYCYAASPVIVGCTFRDCYVDNGVGGGLYANASTVVLERCRFEGNAAGYGAAIYAMNGRLTVSNGVFMSNAAAANGGVLRANSTTGCVVEMFNSLLVGNTAGGQGGVLCGRGAEASLTGCTLSDNSAGSTGGALYGDSGTDLTVTNTILSSNSAPSGRAATIRDGSILAISYSLVGGGQNSMLVESGSDLQWGEGMLTGSPGFVDPLGPDGNSYTVEDNDYHLSADPPSICIDAGYDGGDYQGQVDIDGEAREQLVRVDIGADEAGRALRVRNLRTAARYRTIQEAIDAAGPGDEIVLDPARYYGFGNRDIDFRGKAITVRGEDPLDADVVAATVIDCQGSKADRRRGFLFTGGEGRDSVLAGVTIVNGYAAGGVLSGKTAWMGGAVYCVGTSPTIRNCVIRANTASGVADQSGWGGGIFSINGSPLIEDCVIAANRANGFKDMSSFLESDDGYGGGICCLGGEPEIRGCMLQRNTAEGGYTASGRPPGNAFGGGIYCTGKVQIERCELIDNTVAHRYRAAYSEGGAIYSATEASILDCRIIGNDAVNDWSNHTPDGGGIWCSGTTVIRGCEIRANYTAWGNNSPGGGSGIYCSGDTLVRECLIVDNEAKEMGGGIYGRDDFRVENCLVAGNTARAYETGLGGGGIYCDGNGVIRGCLIAGNHSFYGGGVLSYSYGVGTVDMMGCTIAGNTAWRGGGIMTSGTIVNCILWANAATDGPQISAGSSLEVNHCDVQGGLAEVGGNPVWGPGNFNADPLFVDPAGADGDPLTWQDNNYHLMRISPCRDLGDDAAAVAFADVTTSNGTMDSLVVADAELYMVGDYIRYGGDSAWRTVQGIDPVGNTVTFSPALPEASQVGVTVRNYGAGDLDGRPRIQGPRVDIGAYEVTVSEGDFNGDGLVNAIDLLMLARAFNSRQPDPAYNLWVDANYDGVIDAIDLLALARDWQQP